jgi:flagellar biosynthesis protein FliQ
VDATEAIEVGREAIQVMLWVSLPLLLVSLTIGLAIALFQALTQIQEMTLTFVPKIVVVFFTMLALLPYMLRHLTVFFEGIADKIIGLG